jgi:23S rRNA (uracil1939-C5)-methyltransferase
MFDKIININKCWLQGDPSNQIRNFIKQYADDNHLEFFDRKIQSGLLRNIIVRTSTTGDVMLIVCFFSEQQENREALLAAIAAEFPQITSLMYVINEKGNDTIHDQEIIVYRGNDHIIEEMEGLKFKIGPKSFYQTNSEQAYELYKVARDFAGLKSTDIVYDLYTGTGTIANFIAGNVRKVVGIEYVPEAIEDAHVNSELNGIVNTIFFAGDMKKILTSEFIARHGKPDLIITDPPRAGMDDEVVKTILEASPEKVVYVSCNPATQARDLALMDEFYKVTRIQPVDMFPHTHHVENVVLLERRIS